MAKAVGAFTANTVDKTAAWLESLGTRFVTVRFLTRDGWRDERHVADAETLHETIDMTASRVGARSAVWQHPGDPDGTWRYWRFAAVDEPTRTFPSQEAVEMYAIHRG